MSAPLPSLAKIEADLARPREANAAPLNLVVLRNVTMESIVPYLRYLALQAGFDGRVALGDFGATIQEALAPRSAVLANEADAVLVFTPLETLSRKLTNDFADLVSAEVEQEVQRVIDECVAAIDGIRRQTRSMILWHGFEAPTEPATGIRDVQSEPSQGDVVHRLNRALAAHLRKNANAFLVDVNACLMRVGADAFYDLRYRLMARAPYSAAALAVIASEDFKFVRAQKGRNKKCLVLDCDDTLWGGVVGEDGLAGIGLGDGYPGLAFVEFQREILNLNRRGILVALCSRNNEPDVWEVFDQHPHMLLRRANIAAHRINWNNKVENLRQIAQELNIGLDSLVFADNSPFEIEMVQTALPQVTTLLLPPSMPSQYRQFLARCGLFETPYVTQEDTRRTDMYRAEADRRRAQGSSLDLGEYLRSLQMRVDFGRADADTIPRIAQLTQKTNQFNLTTRRYSETDIKALVSDNRNDVLWMRVADRFGDMGLVGVAVVTHTEGQARIDTFLMSCRILGRGIERAFLDEVVAAASSKGARELTGEFLATAKNAQVAGFYADNGFQMTRKEPAATYFRVATSQYQRRAEDHFAASRQVGPAKLQEAS